MTVAYKSLKVSLEIPADQVETLYFLVSKEFQRIATESPDAFSSPGSWAENVSKLHNQLTFVRDNNFVLATSVFKSQ
jgi:hypothetical protein